MILDKTIVFMDSRERLCLHASAPVGLVARAVKAQVERHDTTRLCERGDVERKVL
jgi:hypothetical protein